MHAASSPAALGGLRRALLAWFREHRRPLPFRGDPEDRADPWAVWVSEVMLQQTRVGAMRPRYGAFLERFPDPEALAAASEDEVLAAWSGLGYYGRARALHRAARRLAAAGEEIPRSAALLRELPGIGPYTAAAIASIAFGEAVAAVDGNVRRVLSRLFAVPGVPGKAGFERRIRKLADRLVAADGGGAPGEWNQALMELGALVCLPGVPACDRCPLVATCAARSAGRETEFPERPRLPPPEAVRLSLALIRDGEGRLLLFRRAESPMRGLYELPGGECREGESSEAALLRGAAAGYGLRVRAGREYPRFRHAVMRRQYAVTPFEASLRAPAPGAPPAAPSAEPPAGGRFVHPRDLDRIPASSLLRKAVAAADSSSEKQEGRG